MQLQRWARVEGQLSPALRTGKGQKIRYFSNRRSLDRLQLTYAFETQVDDQGRFEIDHVPPGWGVVGWYMPLTVGRMDRTYLVNGTRVNIAPGETATAILGGAGVSVTGRVTPPPDSAWGMAGTYAHVELQSLSDAKGPAFPAIPEEVQKMEAAERKAWFQKWVRSPGGTAWMKEYETYCGETVSLWYANGIREDGVFDLPEVPPGRYRMTLSVSTISRGGWNDGTLLGGLTQEVTVPATAPGQKADLGTFVLKTPEQARPR